MVQWLGLYTSNAEGTGLILGQGTKITYATWFGQNIFFLKKALGSYGDAGIENRLVDKGRREEGEGRMNGESSREAYTLTYVNG